MGGRGVVTLALTAGLITAGLGAASPASAGTPLAVTPTSTTQVTASASTTLNDLHVDADSGDTVQATLATSLGTVSLPTHTGLTLSYANNWSGDPSITFTGLPADINGALATAQLAAGNNGGKTAKVSLTAMIAVSGYVYLAPNQHFYQYVPSTNISWTAADSAARAMTFQGQAGYLATIPSQTVNDFVSSKIQGATNVWFGAHAYAPDSSGYARAWRWAIGGGSPIAGDPVSYCASNASSKTCSFANNTGLYSSWASGEPNNYAGTETAAVTNWQGSSGKWNDLIETSSGIGGYVVEYGNQSTGSTGFDGVVRAESPVSIVGAPDAPVGVTATPQDGSAEIEWTPGADNGSTITSYTITSAPGGITKTCSASPCTITGLTNGTSYTFTVSATNSIGTSPDSAASTAVTARTVPDAPTITGVLAGDGTGSVSFIAPANNGGAAVTGYRVKVSPGGATADCPGSPCVVTGLTNGTEYTAVVSAKNAAGDGPASAASNAFTPATTPTAPSSVTASRQAGAAKIEFTASDGRGSDVIEYEVADDNGNTLTTCADSPCTVTGLTNGTSYQFKVRARNGVGYGVYSSLSNSVTPATTPSAVTGLTVTRGDESAVVSFTPSDDGGDAIAGYEYSKDGGNTWQVLTTSGSAPVEGTITGLTNGTSYDIQVRAVNTVGAGAPAGPVPTKPATTPQAPTGVTAAAGDGSAVVSWTAPADGGEPITEYTVTSAPGGITKTCTDSPCIVTGLTNGTEYTFTVTAKNAVGTGSASAASDPVTPAAKPGAPTGLSVTSGAGTLTVRFAAPASTGGVPLSGYEVSTDGGLTWHPLTTSGTSPITGIVSGLTNGTEYPVQVRAVNAAGAGPAAGPVTGTPATVPGKPDKVVAVVRNDAVTVTWQAPASNGGSKITGYVVTAQPSGATCTTTGATTCTFPGLTKGQSYRFTVVATNANGSSAATGIGSGASSTPSKPTPLTGLPSAPRSLRVSPGDRVLGIAFRPPADNGGSRITGYRVSLDGGKHWIRSATTTLTVRGVLNGKTFRVLVQAVNANGRGPATAVVRTATKQWFHDPVSKGKRRGEHGVPRKPARYRGKLEHTVATARSHNGTPAWPAASLHGRQLQAGQAVGLGMGALFAFDSAKLSAAGKRQVRTIVASLRYTHRVTCEGYADYGYRTKHEASLSRQRAKALCTALKRNGADVRTKVKGYGSTRPVVVGGKPSDRAANRRAVLLITR